jgi:hypothetical protein
VQDAAQQQVVWAMLFAVVLLHREYAANQVEGAGLDLVFIFATVCCFFGCSPPSFFFLYELVYLFRAHFCLLSQY